MAEPFIRMSPIMSPFKTVALSLTAVLISFASVQAATPHHRNHVRHPTAHHAMRHGMSSNGMAMRGSTRGGADNSADQLNARSLSQAQGAMQ